MNKVPQLADEFGLPYVEVERTLENLEKKGLVEKIVIEGEVIWRIR